VVAAIGDFDAAALTAQLQQGLGDWTSKAAFVRVPQPYVAIAAAQFRIEVKDKQNAFSFGRIGFPLRESDREFQALRLAMQIFGGSGSGRLWDRIREKEGLSYGVGASVGGGQFNANAQCYVYAISAPQNADRVKAAFDEELARARREGFTADELTRAKEAIVAASRLARAQDPGLAAALVNFVERAKTPLFLAELDDLRAAITLDEVNAAFRKYVVPEQIVYAVAGDLANAKAAAAGTPIAGAAPK
jgi:zinc protease